MSPTARSLQALRARGYLAGVVERWNPGARVRQDYLGFADILAVKADVPGVLAIQACVTGDQSKRLAKLATPPVRARATVWVQAGNRLAIWGWAKRGARGQQKRWICSETEWHTTAEFLPPAATAPAPPGARREPEAG